jgi:hypothetical protein
MITGNVVPPADPFADRVAALRNVRLIVRSPLRRVPRPFGPLAQATAANQRDASVTK